ncbi:MAG TPA: efflux RND transporter periplasmic adaptor subunit [Anaeromyxobacteraceae bacterium]
MSGETSPRARRRLLVALAIAVVLALVGAVALSVARHRRDAAQRERLAHAADEGPRVLVAPVGLPTAERKVTLPGDVRALLQTTLYAKVNGYVSEMRVDKGDRVKRGQVLAHIAAPETDRQVDSARSTLEVRRRFAARARRLAPKGIMSQQELDQANADLRGAAAEYRRVRALQDYEVLRAPFDGVVTARYVDPGALLSASATGQPVVELADPERVRVLVYVGQDLAPFVKLGDRAEITLDQAPAARAAATVRRMAEALDLRSRSMLVELWLDGDGGLRLVPGLFVHAALTVAVPPLPSIPADGLVARGDRLQVAVVRDRKLHFVDVEPGASDGRVIGIRRGLAGGEVIALSPPSDLGEGAPIQPITPDQQRKEGAPRGQRAARTPP